MIESFQALRSKSPLGVHKAQFLMHEMPQVPGRAKN